MELHPWLSMKGFLSSSIIFSRTKIVRYHHGYAAEDRAPLGSDPSAAAGQTAAGGIRKRVPLVFSILLVAQSDKSMPTHAATTPLANNRSCTGSGLAPLEAVDNYPFVLARTCDPTRRQFLVRCGRPTYSET
jgi:hypothetical protein